MKQIFFSLIIVASLCSEAQVKLGLKAAPVIVSNRVINDARDVEADGSSLKLSIGLIVDKPISDTYFLSSGLIYMPKRVAFRTEDNTLKEEYKLQYLQLPATLKLFTNEIVPDMKLFFQVGGGIEINIFDEPEDASFITIEKFNPLDFSVILGSGMEYRAGVNTTIFAGLSYQRGLSNTVNEMAMAANVTDLQIKTTIVSFDLGVKL